MSAPTRTSQPAQPVAPEAPTTPSVLSLSPEALLRGQQEVLELIAANAPLAESLTAIARFAERSIPELMASILYYDPKAKRLRSGGYARLPDSFARIVDGLVPGPNMGSCGTSAYTGERVISPDVYQDPRWTIFLPQCEIYGIRAAWSTPLLHSRDGSVLGVFGMYYPTARTPSAADLEFVDHFTHLATLAAERHRDDERQRELANHDALTGLGNRNLLQGQGRASIDAALRTGTPLCLAFIDLDKFKLYNDQFGHIAGDALLRSIGERIQAALTPAEAIVRFGGDEFVVLLREPLEGARDRLRALANDLTRGVGVADSRVSVTFSCGLAELGPAIHDLDTLLFHADEAARRAKALGGDRCEIADTETSRRSRRRLQIARDLQETLDAGRIDPHLQPLMSLVDRRPVGFEMLFRAQHPRLAKALVTECIEVAEETGHIHRLGLEMLAAAFCLAADARKPLGDLTINVNLSVLQIMRSGFVEQVRELAQRFQVNPARICLELTESQWLDTEGPARQTLIDLSRLGFPLALDDFGAGYASLNYLQSLPFTTVKIDRSFISRLNGDRSASALCAALLAMGKACDLNVLAEGVETSEQARELQAMGFHLGQGYLWARPMTRQAAADWLSGARGG